jgi:hypothetical protein
LTTRFTHSLATLQTLDAQNARHLQAKTSPVRRRKSLRSQMRRDQKEKKGVDEKQEIKNPKLSLLTFRNASQTNRREPTRGPS